MSAISVLLSDWKMKSERWRNTVPCQPYHWPRETQLLSSVIRSGTQVRLTQSSSLFFLLGHVWQPEDHCWPERKPIWRTGTGDSRPHAWGECPLEAEVHSAVGCQHATADTGLRNHKDAFLSVVAGETLSVTQSWEITLGGHQILWLKYLSHSSTMIF